MRIGILGGGQLAQLLSASAYSLGLETLCLVDEIHCPASRTSPVMLGTLNENELIKEFIEAADVCTLENENIDVGLLSLLEEKGPVYPKPNSIAIAQDRLLEKQCFQALNIPVPNYIEIDSEQDLHQALKEIGMPAVLKTRRFGYDGKGQVVIKSLDQAATAWLAIGAKPAILESFVPFEFEVSLIAARSLSGDIVFYPLIKNTHQHGILQLSEFPYKDSALQKQAEGYVGKLLEHFQYVGVLAFEFFVMNYGLLANEIAPRVHNSGHLTIEATTCSQFENHLRAISGMPLVQPETIAPALMINIIGSWPKLENSDIGTGVHIYNYGKKERPGRKLGHITILDTHKALPEVLAQMIAKDK